LDIEKSSESILYAPKDATPIEPDDLQFLIPKLRTRAQLNALEQRNIVGAKVEAQRSRNMRRSLINVESLTKLHFLMFNEVWTWAGTFRTRASNIGIDAHQIRDQLAALCADAQFWAENNTFPLDQRAIRLHHKLVKIHLFPNGNGRHSRLVADLMMFYGKQPEFSWGGASLDVGGKTRARYLAALRKADSGNYNELLEFAVSE
jgi:Fic-DOC domain mobile mystery protein B